MCGVCGVLSWDGGTPADEARLAPLVEALQHRGPDDWGLERWGAVVLGHTRLAIRGQARQPLRLPDGEGLLSFNGEIYNTRELSRKLGHEGDEESSDSAVLAHWLAAAGSLAALNGIFAFAWWRPQRGELWLVRDRFGIKPLYYAQLPGGVVFASEVSAMARLEGFSRQPNLDQVWSYLAATPPVHGPTLWKGVQSVPPGTVVRIRLGDRRILTERFADVGPLPQRPCADADELSVRLRGALEAQLVSERPVCLSLSGGLDSSLIAAMTVEIGRRLPAFTVRWREERDLPAPYLDGDDAEHAVAVARHLGLPLTTVGVTSHFSEEQISRAIWHRGQPLSHTTELALQELYKAMSEGHSVALTGEGADEVWGGYPFFSGRPRRRRLPWASLDFADLERVLAPQLLARHRVRDRLLEAARRYAQEPLEEAVLKGFLPYLLDRLDRHSMAHSVESRVPFLDLQLLGFAGCRHGDGEGAASKVLLRQLAASRLPRSVAQRPKSAFPPSTSRVGSRRVLGLLGGRIAGGHSRIAAWLKPGALREMAAWSDGQVSGRVLAWRLLNLDLWLQQVEEGGP